MTDMKHLATKTLALTALIALAATAACTPHNDADKAVPGGNAAGTASSAAPASASTASRSR